MASTIEQASTSDLSNEHSVPTSPRNSVLLPKTSEPVSQTGDTKSELSPVEAAWRSKQPYLESKGYILRPRYRPGWVPSWTVSGKSRDECEDGIVLPRNQKDFIDATRISDRKTVCIKRVRTEDTEYVIAIKLSSSDFAEDHRNHSVPIWDHFPDDEDPSTSYIVMPFLLPASACSFTTIWHVVVFCDRVLEGLVFLHEKGISHRDCSYRKIMVDPSALYPGGVHPVKTSMTLDGVTPVTPPPQIPPYNLRFYFTGFSKSVFVPPSPGAGKHRRSSRDPQISPGEEQQGLPEKEAIPPLEPPIQLTQKPETDDTDLTPDGEPSQLRQGGEIESVSGPSGPLNRSSFPITPDTRKDQSLNEDVLTIGNVLKKEFLEKYSNIGFLEPLVRSMTQQGAAAADVLRLWRNIEKPLTHARRRRKLVARKTSFPFASKIGLFFCLHS